MALTAINYIGIDRSIRSHFTCHDIKRHIQQFI